MRQKYRNRLRNLARALREYRGRFEMSHPSFCAFAVYAQSRRQRTFAWNAAHGTPELACNSCPIVYYGSEVRAHFGISEEQQSQLFAGHGMNSAKTPAEAADFVERFLETIK